MDELSAQLARILSDPEQMAQISQLASSLGLGGAPEAPDAAPKTAPEAEGGFDAEALHRLLPLLSRASGKEAQVLSALRPHLDRADQQRVDRALRAAKLSRLARLAMNELGRGGPGELL